MNAIFFRNGKSRLYMPVACLALIGAMTGCQTTGSQSVATVPTTTTTNVRSGENVAGIRVALAAQYIAEGKLDEAKRQLEQAFASDSRYAPAYDMMGVLLQQEGSAANLGKADSYFRRAISLDPNFIQAHNNYGVYLSRTNHYAEAVKQFEIAAAALGYEGRAGALENLGRMLLKTGNTARAEEVFVRALEASQNSLVARVELIDLLLKKNKILQAKQLYEELLALLGQNSLPPRVLWQGIRIAAAQNNTILQQKLSQQLLSQYPLSDEAKQLKTWLSHPGVVRK